MRKFTVNKDNKKLDPTDAQIKRHKDFSRLHHDYEKLTKRGKKPLYRDPKMFLFFLIIGIILLLIFLGEI
ncbi:MAG: hypothetical protein HWE22_03625 [Flavobacteriales bacterium]|jgi:hypothetical protein|nr:hypothetical protein [Flavobacteriales bacterium]PIE87396.1 MAG: hypothetical protein CSA03_00530 [Bacteroidota bacterium]